MHRMYFLRRRSCVHPSSFQTPRETLNVTINLLRRTVTCSMTVKAPGDRKRASASINWLVRQLKKIDSADVLVRTYWAGRSGQTQAPLSDVLEYPKCLEEGIKGPLPSRFEVAMVRDLAGRFFREKDFYRRCRSGSSGILRPSGTTCAGLDSTATADRKARSHWIGRGWLAERSCRRQPGSKRGRVTGPPCFPARPE